MMPTELKFTKDVAITGLVRGHNVFAGNRRMVEELSIQMDQAANQQAHQWEREGKTVSFMGWNGEVRAVASFGDNLRPEAVGLIVELKQHGLETRLISGDSRATTRWIASRLGVDSFEAEVLPEAKVDAIRRFQERGGVVAMVGDGINDAPALAQADLGIAMGSGTDIAMKAAAVVLINNSLRKILDVFDLAEVTVRVVRQNLFWAFFYNTVGITLAVLGVLNPIMAASGMLLSVFQSWPTRCASRETLGRPKPAPPLASHGLKHRND